MVQDVDEYQSLHGDCESIEKVAYCQAEPIVLYWVKKLQIAFGLRENTVTVIQLGEDNENIDVQGGLPISKIGYVGEAEQEFQRFLGMIQRDTLEPPEPMI